MSAPISRHAQRVAARPVLDAVRAVVLAVWPLLVLTLVLLLAALGWWAASDDHQPLLLAVGFAEVVVLGLVGSFALHEAAHVAVLRRTPTVTHLVLERTAWRISVLAAGTLTTGRSAAVALAGPGACLVVGLGLRWSGSPLAWWYLAHVLLLLPVFADGRALVAAVRPRALAERPGPPA